MPRIANKNDTIIELGDNQGDFSPAYLGLKLHEKTRDFPLKHIIT